MPNVLIDTRAVKKAQINKGLTNNKVSQLAGLNPVYYDHFFKEEVKKCRAATVKALAECLEVSETELHAHQ